MDLVLSSPFWGVSWDLFWEFVPVLLGQSRNSQILYSLILYIGWGIGVGGLAVGASIFLYFNWDIYLF